jgi:reverse gyrase
MTTTPPGKPKAKKAKPKKAPSKASASGSKPAGKPASKAASKKAQPEVEAVEVEASEAEPAEVGAGKAPRGRRNSLLIVESPAKAKTIQKYLGRGYTVLASKGHVKDLPKRQMPAPEDGFRESYEVIQEKGKDQTLREIQQAARKADRVLLATDPDRTRPRAAATGGLPRRLGFVVLVAAVPHRAQGGQVLLE